MANDARLKTLAVIFLLLLGAVIVRLLDLQIFRHDFFEKLSLKQRTRIIDLAASRGDVYDRNGEIMATSIDTYSLFRQEPHFAWVARKLPLAAAEQLKKAGSAEVFMIKEKKRIYPQNNLAAQVLGFVGADNQGLSGIELSYDRYLKGKTGQIITEGDPQGRELYGAVREIDPGEDGMNVTLTLDQNLQYIAEQEIQAVVRQFKATSGMLIVMDAKSGELLALASKPDFDPNAYGKADSRLWHPRFLDPYEPGSTFKLITAAAGLQDGVIDQNTKLKALNRLEIGGKIIQNSHQIAWPGPDISVSFMLEQSINTGAAQIGIMLGPERFYKRLKQFGFGELTDFGLDGESRGIVRYWENWYKPDVAMITFGQGIAVTPLQLLSAVSAFGNKGRAVKPYLVKRIESNDGNFVKVYAETERGRPVSEKVAAEMKKLMRDVVVSGSGRKAQMAWYSVGGKTGTAQKALPGGRGYLKGRYIASFIGLAPLSDPRIAALVIVDDPKGVIWGETVAGPAFKNVVEYALRYLNVKPDMI